MSKQPESRELTPEDMLLSGMISSFGLEERSHLERSATGRVQKVLTLCKERLKEVLSELTLRERAILKMRYGLADDKPATLEEVSEVFQISREEVRAFELKAVLKFWQKFPRKSHRA